MELGTVADELTAGLAGLKFGPPIAHVYNPLVYARAAYDVYLERHAAPPKEVVLLGMNPGPWGMAQTGVPFGDVEAVRNWLMIETEVGAPKKVHPKKPVTGFACRKREVSGRRLWGWARNAFGSPETFFARFFVANYCPLLFLDSHGRNCTPDKVPAADRQPLLALCDQALRRTVTYLKPRYVIGIGNFARDRALQALAGGICTVGGILHPSPANPKANRGWEKHIEGELTALGIRSRPL